jgi:hypothetical protein
MNLAFAEFPLHVSAVWDDTPISLQCFPPACGFVQMSMARENGTVLPVEQRDWSARTQVPALVNSGPIVSSNCKSRGTGEAGSHIEIRHLLMLRRYAWSFGLPSMRSPLQFHPKPWVFVKTKFAMS